MAISDHLLNCVEDTPREEPILEEIEPTTYPQVQESEEESIDEEILCMDKPTSSIETCANNNSSEDSDQTFFDSLLDGYDYVCPKDGWNLKSWDELLMDVAWMILHGNRRTLQNLEELPLHSEEAKKKFLTWGNTKMLQCISGRTRAQDIDDLLYDPKWRILLFLHALASLEATIEFLCSLRFLNNGEEATSSGEVISTTKSLEARVPVNLATFVARFVFAQSTCDRQFVLCGPMVTLLARGLRMSVPNVLLEAASMFRPLTGYLAQIAYNKEDKEARPRRHHTIPISLCELSQAMFAFQDSVDSRLRSIETLLLT
ncbi:unnamed protein product [Cuscuta campestris]|uniref:Uncharacterized protein n=1 Tax=Cuscuta campestris TaxID=132261 RepID=A0A484M3I2_9ASTE|nr:unnamed protein product [Cuscuta campestris]